MSVSIRAVLMPGGALAAVAAVALAPTLVAPTAAPEQPHVAVPAVYIADVQLAGIGRDIYNSASAVVQGLAQWAQWAVGIIPFLGSGIAAQINLIYAELIQPLIGNTVYALSDIIANPLGLLTTAGSYVSNQVYIGYTFVASEIRFFGLPPILGPMPKPPPLASVARGRGSSGSGRSARGPDGSGSESGRGRPRCASSRRQDCGRRRPGGGSRRCRPARPARRSQVPFHR